MLPLRVRAAPPHCELTASQEGQISRRFRHTRLAQARVMEPPSRGNRRRRNRSFVKQRDCLKETGKRRNGAQIDITTGGIFPTILDHPDKMMIRLQESFQPVPALEPGQGDLSFWRRSSLWQRPLFPVSGSARCFWIGSKASRNYRRIGAVKTQSL